MPSKALLCWSCANNYRDKCVVCNQYVSSDSYPARICDNCASTKQGMCCVCGNYGADTPALVCYQHKDRCAICGAYL